MKSRGEAKIKRARAVELVMEGKSYDVIACEVFSRHPRVAALRADEPAPAPADDLILHALPDHFDGLGKMEGTVLGLAHVRNGEKGE